MNLSEKVRFDSQSLVLTTITLQFFFFLAHLNATGTTLEGSCRRSPDFRLHITTPSHSRPRRSCRLMASEMSRPTLSREKKLSYKATTSYLLPTLILFFNMRFGGVKLQCLNITKSLLSVTIYYVTIKRHYI